MSAPFYAFTSYGAHWDATRRDYLQVRFTQKCKVYLLLVDKARVPPWVKSKGFKLLREYSLEVDWELELAFKIIAVMTQRLDECKKAKLHLYASDAVYEPGVTHSFGGMCGKQLLDYTYVFMWRPLTAKELSGVAADAVEKQQGVMEDSDTNADNRARRKEVCRSIVDHVDKGNLDLLRESCRVYRDLIAEAQQQSTDDAMVAQSALGGSGSQHLQRPAAKGSTEAASVRAPAEMRLHEESSHESGVDADATVYTGGPAAGGARSARFVLTSAASAAAAAAAGRPAADSRRVSVSCAVAVPQLAQPPLSAFVTKSGELLTSRAMQVYDPDPKMVLLLVSQGAEINSEVLRYVLDNVNELPCCGYVSIAHFMLSYLWHQRNPIACSMIMAQHLLAISGQHTTKTKEFRELGHKLRKLTICLVEKLERLVAGSNSIKVDEEEAEPAGGGAEDQEGHEAPEAQPQGTRGQKQGRSLSGRSFSSDRGEQGMTTSLEDVLAPHGIALSINDASPMQVAYDHEDDEFMSTGVVQEYCKAHWLGAAYQANALMEVQGTSAVHVRDNRTVFKLFNNAGFVGSLGEPFMLIFSRMAHVLMLSCRPYFESPRGRWAFHMMCEAFLLYVFHAVQLLQNEDGLEWQHLVLTLYVASMVVDEVQEVAHKYQRRLAVYFTDGFNVVEAITILLLLGSGGCKIGMLVVGSGDPAWDQLRTAKDFLFNTTAIFLWLRGLQFLLPVLDGLGALLMVTSKMVWEVLKFAVLGMMVMMGVAFTMYGMYKERDVPSLDSFANVLLLLFRTFLGETMFDVLLTEKSTLYNLYGNLIVLVYTLAATVILANLLIAIISYHFKPDKVEPQSRFQAAEILQQYEYRVTHHLIGAPFSLPLLLVKAVLPSGTRCMLNERVATVLFSIGIVNLDGNPLPDESAESTFFPTGSSELPYLIFLLTFYPVLIAATWALGLVMAPYCIFYFAVKGCNVWLPERVQAVTTPWMLASKANSSQAKGERVPAASEGSSARVAPEPSSDKLSELPELLDALDEDYELDAVGGRDARAHHGDSPQKHSKLALGAVHLLQLGLLPLQCVLFVAVRLFMAAIGAVIYLVALIGFCTMVWLGTYQYLARIFFSCFWVLQGWFGDLAVLGSNGVAVEALSARNGSVSRSKQAGGEDGSSAAASVMRTSTRVLDQRWVRVNQAALKDRGQVLTKEEIEAAMLEAGFAEEEVREAGLFVDEHQQPATSAGRGR